MKRPTQDLIDEWFDSEVTRYFHYLVKHACDALYVEKAAQGYDGKSAEHLMAHRANLCGLETAFVQIEQVFEEQSFDDLEVDDEERVGDTSLGGSGPH